MAEPANRREGWRVTDVRVRGKFESATGSVFRDRIALILQIVPRCFGACGIVRIVRILVSDSDGAGIVAIGDAPPSSRARLGSDCQAAAALEDSS